MKTEQLVHLIACALQTRKYGHCYVRSAMRPDWSGVTDGDLRLTMSPYGRSLQSGGHKYKVHATNAETGKPYPSTFLRSLHTQLTSAMKPLATA